MFQVKKRVATLAILVASSMVAQADDIAFHTEYIPHTLFDAKKTDPQEIVGETSQKLCQEMYDRDDFTFYRFENDARLREKRFGYASLDADDRKWIANPEFRKAACMQILEKAGTMGLWSQVKVAIIRFLNSH